MIQLVVASESKSQLEEIAKFLLTNHLVISVEFHLDIKRLEFDGNEISTTTTNFITGKTKSLLFSEIDMRLREKYKDNLPEIYSHPITDMDWNLAKKLKKDIEKI